MCTSALGSGSMTRAAILDFRIDAQCLDGFEQLLETRELGLVVKRGGKIIKEDGEGKSLRYKKKGKMKVDIMRNTS